MDRRGQVIAAATVVVFLAASVFAFAKLLDRTVVDLDGCRARTPVSQLIHVPGERSWFALSLPAARTTSARVEAIKPRGTVDARSLRYFVARDGALGDLLDRSTKDASAVEQVPLRPPRDAVLRADPKGNPRSGWSLVIRYDARAPGISFLGGLEIRYVARGHTTVCVHDLSVQILVGATTRDAASAPRAYRGAWYKHRLFTHCGITATAFGGLEWVANPPLSDGSGNPPPLWDNPYEEGEIVLAQPNVAIFRTSDGLEAAFRPRAVADAPEGGCD